MHAAAAPRAEIVSGTDSQIQSTAVVAMIAAK